MNIKTIKQIKDLKNKRVLMRCDFNVPIKDGVVKDDFKIKKTLPTIDYLLNKGARLILTSHLGRPDGEVKPEFSLEPVKKRLQFLLNKDIKLFKMSDLAKLAEYDFSASQVAMLENTRYSPDEKKDVGSFAKDLSNVADIFVSDCFGVAHRAHASIVGPARHLPAYAGLLLEQEVQGLSKVMTEPEHPFVAILGGAKMETKIPVLKNMLEKADKILVGGGIVNTYLWAKGYKVGKSLIDQNLKKEAEIYGDKKKVIMPIDVVVGSFDGEQHQVMKIDKNFKLKSGWGIFDIGPETIKMYSMYIKQAQTLVWNGAVGYFEQHPYEYGTHSVARLVASRSKGHAFGVCGGGETVEVLKKLKIIDDVDLVSTGGGSMLEFLSGKSLPGVEIVKI
ncbi:MAG: phosphoglycerate kinase [bacterium]